MRATPLDIPGSYLFRAPTFPDNRGFFSAPFHGPTFDNTVGYSLDIRQTNISPTVRGAVRGIHFADVPPGQAKYVYAASGTVLDVIVDLRVGSPTFGQHCAVELNRDDATAVFLPVGVGHLVVGVSDNAAVSYLCSAPFTPSAEHGICPFDEEVALPFAHWCHHYDLGTPSDLILSEKDRGAPTLAESQACAALPLYDECSAYVKQLRS